MPRCDCGARAECPDCDSCYSCCCCDDGPFDEDELGLDPEDDDERPTVEQLLRRKGPHYPGEILED